MQFTKNLNTKPQETSSSKVGPYFEKTFLFQVQSSEWAGSSFTNANSEYRKPPSHRHPAAVHGDWLGSTSHLKASQQKPEKTDMGTAARRPRDAPGGGQEPKPAMWGCKGKIPGVFVCLVQNA